MSKSIYHPFEESTHVDFLQSAITAVHRFLERCVTGYTQDLSRCRQVAMEHLWAYEPVIHQLPLPRLYGSELTLSRRTLLAALSLPLIDNAGSTVRIRLIWEKGVHEYWGTYDEYRTVWETFIQSGSCPLSLQQLQETLGFIAMDSTPYAHDVIGELSQLFPLWFGEEP